MTNLETLSLICKLFIEIFYIYGNNINPDEPNLEVHRDFFLSSQKIKITQRGFEATFEL